MQIYCRASWCYSVNSYTRNACFNLHFTSLFLNGAFCVHFNSIAIELNVPRGSSCSIAIELTLVTFGHVLKRPVWTRTFHQRTIIKSSETRLWRNYSGPRVEFPCPTSVRGLSGKIVDTACFHCFLYIYQTSFKCYNSVIQKWIKYKTGTVLCDIFAQYLLLWQRRVESKVLKLYISNIIYLFQYYHF